MARGGQCEHVRDIPAIHPERAEDRVFPAHEGNQGRQGSPVHTHPDQHGPPPFSDGTQGQFHGLLQPDKLQGQIQSIAAQMTADGFRHILRPRIDGEVRARLQGAFACQRIRVHGNDLGGFQQFCQQDGVRTQPPAPKHPHRFSRLQVSPGTQCMKRRGHPIGGHGAHIERDLIREGNDGARGGYHELRQRPIAVHAIHPG